MHKHSEIYRSPPRLNTDSLTLLSKHLCVYVSAVSGSLREDVPARAASEVSGHYDANNFVVIRKRTRR